MGDTVLLAPSSLFRERSEVEVYYEVRGTRTGQGYRHEITILRDTGRQDARERPLVAVSFGEAASGPVVRSGRTVQLEGLKKGNYLVQVRIIGPDGESQVRRRALKLIHR
jgi:hypothetical protein